MSALACAADEIRLENTQLSVRLLPSLGASLGRFDYIADGQRKPIMRALDPGSGRCGPNDSACYPLVPWSNRIGAGSFLFEGKCYNVARTHPDFVYPIHGHGWLGRWQTIEWGQQFARLRLRHTTPDPFLYDAEICYRLTGESLCVNLAVTNSGPEKLPFGLGLHPWFVRGLDVTLRAAASGIWMAGEDLLPTHCCAPRADEDFFAPRTLPSRLIDNCYSGWTGDAEIIWPERGLRLRIATTPATEHFVLYCPPGSGFFCFEPVTHVSNAFNMSGATDALGLRVLGKAESMSVSITFEVSDLG